ncbi:MAG: MTAP family purine nucleoside phosphorylase [Armatimonadota bacterium]|nr:MTAP family purine nucleoside phosphorylase [Armatimonadota bacterium]
MENGIEILLLSRHGERGYEVSAPFVNYRANIWALKELGAERIIAWSGPGAIDRSISVGEIVVPDDVVDETRRRPGTFYEGLGIGFIRQNPVFCPEIAAGLRQAVIRKQGYCRERDVYVCTEGPRLETVAEIRKMALYGGTLVGMTVCPEVFLARELEICYCPVCYVSNYAEGTVDRPYVVGELFEGMLTAEERARVDEAVALLPEIILEAFAGLPKARSCPCGRSMERYRRRGDIGDDWHTWISKSV